MWEAPDRWLGAGTLRFGDRELRVVPTPGHTKGHVVFLDEQRGLLFSGDHVLPHITPSIGFELAEPGGRPLADYLDSLRLMTRYADARLLPAHGPVADSAHTRVAELLVHHDERLAKSLAAPTYRTFTGLVVGLIAQTCLPVLARLWQPRHIGKLAHAREMAELIAARYPGRTVHVVGDAAYVGEYLRGLGETLTWTSRLKVTSVLHELAPPRTEKKGRPRTKGNRLGTPADLAATATWRTTQVAATDAPTPCRSPRSSACGTAPSTPAPSASSSSVTTSPQFPR
ncbi:MBL fold metallo-hydrolase [Streptomyces sp. NPDC059679]|uniref:MBL fold metallo-hydrolase n=1 Tax=Streptomyces sp. NPDC059679 TaxID=3346903 RepID=UPI0036AF9D55